MAYPITIIVQPVSSASFEPINLDRARQEKNHRSLSVAWFGIRDYLLQNGAQNLPSNKATAQEIRTWLYGDANKVNSTVKKITAMHLPFFDIETIPEEIRLFTNLTSLSMICNKITKLPPNQFKGLVNLKRLSFYNNQIQEIDAGAFDGLSELDHLDLSENCIEKISLTHLGLLANLREVDLSDNPITETIPGLENEPDIEKQPVIIQRHLSQLREKEEFKE